MCTCRALVGGAYIPITLPTPGATQGSIPTTKSTAGANRGQVTQIIKVLEIVFLKIGLSMGIIYMMGNPD